MIVRICRFPLLSYTLSLCVIVLAALLVCAPVARAGDDNTLLFLRKLRRNFRPLDDNWSEHATDYCNWVFVSCDKLTGMVSLDLSDRDLKGHYPDVGRLDGSQIRIAALNMSFNPQIDGELRSDWKKLTNLKVLDLSSTKTKGDLPDDWGELSNLEFLNLSNTKVDDDIPDDWDELSNLIVLDLRNTEVDKIDVEKVGKGMKKLEVLQLGETEVDDILEQLTSNAYFPNLRILNVSYPVDTETEELPSRLAAWASGLPFLEYVNFNGFGFTGCVPHSYRQVPVLMQAARRANVGLVLREGKCSAYKCSSSDRLNDDTKRFLDLLKASPLMQDAAPLWSGADRCGWQGVTCPATCGAGIAVDLSSLPLSGSLPDTFATLGDAAVLIDSFVVRNNAGLAGALPASLAAALSLARHVELSAVSLHNTIPPAFGPSLHYVEHLAITHTSVCGGLPDWPATNGPPLHHVDLSNNRMGGSLSATWAALPLETVDLRGNDFCGCVPDAWRSSALLMGSLDAAVAAAGTASACDFINGCGNPNQQCDSVVAASPTTDTREFLMALKSAFPSQLQDWGTSDDYCDGSWTRVSCVSTGGGFHEVLLTLSNAGLSGSLPEAPATVVGSRVLVASIDVSANGDLAGSLPVSWGRLSYLRTLILDNCGFRGDLPNAWEGMTSLTTLSVVGAKLCRGLPRWHAAKMPQLRQIDISANEMYGGLSDSFGEFGPQLTYFNATRNKFCGCVPDSWQPYYVLNVGVDSDVATAKCSLASNACGRYSMKCETIDDGLLNFKDVNWNFLDVVKKSVNANADAAKDRTAADIFATWTGYEFCNYKAVSCSFHDGSNGFSLDLRGVGLRGTLPSISSDFKSAVAARSIDLSNNPDLTGTLPPSWGELTNLVYLDLSNTAVQSSMPTSWQNMHNLNFLSLAQTQVCGAIPEWSADKFASVVSMDFSHSKLAGTLSAAFGSFGLSNLATLRLEGNDGLCACAPEAWLDGRVLPDALISTFGTLPKISDSCSSSCSSPPSCVNPEGDGDSGDGAVHLNGVFASHAVAMIAVIILLV